VADLEGITVRWWVGTWCPLPCVGAGVLPPGDRSLRTWLLGGAHFSAGGFGDSAFALDIGAGHGPEIRRDSAADVFSGDYLLTSSEVRRQLREHLAGPLFLRF